MFEWTGYKISDFLLFSREVFNGAFETYNHDIWPLQILWILIGLTILGSFFRSRQWPRAVAFSFSASWAFIAWFYHWKTFVPINWAAKYFASLFAVEAVLIFLFGTLGNHFQIRRPKTFLSWIGILLITLTLLPLEIFWKSEWSQIVLFGWGPDQTAVATIGLLLISTFRSTHSLLYLPPILWCLTSALIYFGMKS